MIRSFWVATALTAAVLCQTVIASGKSTQVKDLGVGKSLVSSRDLSDPNFAESVVLLVQHDQDGTVGLMINHRTRVPISRVIRNLDAGKHGADLIYVGGPVQMVAVLGLFRSRQKPDEGISVLRDVYLISSKALLEKAITATSSAGDLRLYLGYCGWGAGQLDNEVRRGAWWIFEANAATVFDPNPGSVWSRLIARTEQQIAETAQEPLRREASDP
jgi:putative transcriptional regulator